MSNHWLTFSYNRRQKYIEDHLKYFWILSATHTGYKKTCDKMPEKRASKSTYAQNLKEMISCLLKAELDLLEINFKWPRWVI